MENKKTKRLYFIISIIGILMLLNIILIKQNGNQIEKNQEIITTTEEVVIASEDLIQTLHLVDVAIRGYVITLDSQMYSSPSDSAEVRKNHAFQFLEEALKKQNYQLNQFNELRDRVNAYFSFTKEIASQIELGNNEKASDMIAEDRGYPVWVITNDFTNDVALFEQEIGKKAYIKFNQAIKTSFWLQVILFLLAMPTLLYAAIYSSRAINLSEKLRISEKEKANILENQKETLERLVRERTDEILAQNEEIRAQNEEISLQNDIIMKHNEEMVGQQVLIAEKNEELSAQNEILNNAKATIENQQKLLELKNEELSDEIARQNENLKQTNIELIDQINKLEQFGYIISHNLRAPTARLIGLGNLIDKTDENEKAKIVKLMIQSSKELHEVIDDMGRVLLVQKPGSKIVENVSLSKSLEKVKNILRHEIDKTHAVIEENWGDESSIQSFPLYIESIFYNLISNAIKYHQKHKSPIIKLSSFSTDENIIIVIEDNGMGIDLERYGEKLFGLYKRFHLHVEGKGLGLYLVKSQIEALGGRIEVESQIGRGTKFTIHLHK